MDAARLLGFDIESTRPDMVSYAKQNMDEQILKDVRLKLFDEAKTGKLCDGKDVLVARQRRAQGLSMKEKLAGDVADLIYYFKNRRPLPHTLLNNGKRGR